MSQKELISIYKLDFYKRQQNWRLANNQKAKTSRKVPREPKNKSKLNNTYTVERSSKTAAEEPAVEPPELNEAFIDSGSKEESVLPAQENVIKEEKDIIKPKVEYIETKDANNNTEPKNKSFDKDYLQNLIKTDALIREKFENHWNTEKIKNCEQNQSSDHQIEDWQTAAKIWTQSIGIRNEANNLFDCTPSQDKFNQPPTFWTQNQPFYHASNNIQTEQKFWLQTPDVAPMYNLENLPDTFVNHDWNTGQGNVADCWQNPNGGWSDEEQKTETDWAREISEDIPDGVDWSSEAEAALDDAEEFLRDTTLGQMSEWSSLDSEKFMLDAAVRPHSSEKDLRIATVRSSSSGGSLKGLVSQQARVLKRLLLQARAEDAQAQKLANLQSQSPSFEVPTRDVGPNTPTPSLVRQITFTRRQTLGPSLGQNFRSRAKDNSFVCGSFKNLEGFEGTSRGRGRIVLRGGRPYRAFD